MIAMIKEHSNLFNTLSFKNRKYLNIIPDPTTIDAPPTSANSSRNSSVERHRRTMTTSNHQNYHSLLSLVDNEWYTYPVKSPRV